MTNKDIERQTMQTIMKDGETLLCKHPKEKHAKIDKNEYQMFKTCKKRRTENEKTDLERE